MQKNGIGRRQDQRSSCLVVRARSLDVSRLLALVADFLSAGRLLGAVAGEVSVLATVVALGAVGAVSCPAVRCVGGKKSSAWGTLTRHVTISTARVALTLLTTAIAAALAATTTTTAAAAVGGVATSEGVAAIGLHTVAGDMPDLATLGGQAALEKFSDRALGH